MTLRPIHAAVMLVSGFAAGQALGGVLAIAGFAVAVATGGLDRSVLGGPEGILRVMAHPLVLIPSAIGSSLGLVTVAIGTPLVLRVPVREALAIRRPPAPVWLLAPVGALGVAFVADQAVFYFGRALPRFTLGALGAFGDAARAGGPVAGTAVWIGMALVPGICEELFFRGALQGALSARWKGPLAVVVASVAFGAVHVDPPQALGAAILGLYLGFVTHRARSVGPAIVAHIANNTVAFLSANLVAFGDFGYGTPNAVPWPVFGAGALVASACALGTSAVCRRRDPQ